MPDRRSPRTAAKKPGERPAQTPMTPRALMARLGSAFMTPAPSAAGSPKETPKARSKEPPAPQGEKLGFVALLALCAGLGGGYVGAKLFRPPTPGEQIEQRAVQAALKAVEPAVQRAQQELSLAKTQLLDLQQEVRAAVEDKRKAQASLNDAVEGIKALQRDLAAQLRAENADTERKVASSQEKLGKRVDAAEGTAQAGRAQLAKAMQKFAEMEAALDARLEQERDQGPAYAELGPEWAADSIGATIDHAGTTVGLGTTGYKELLSAITPSIVSGETWRGVSWKPEVVLEKQLVVSTGRCFSLPVVGNLTVKLPTRVRLTAVGVEHLRLRANKTSAPVSVRAFAEGAGGAARLVQWNATERAIARTEGVTDKVRFEVLSNGGANFTCIYRVYVFGELA